MIHIKTNVKMFIYRNTVVVKRFKNPIEVKKLECPYMDVQYKEEPWEIIINKDRKKELRLTDKNVYEPFTGKKVTLLREVKIKEEDSIRSSLGRTKRELYNKCLMEDWEWFLTFTFKEKDKLEYDECVKKIGNFLDNLKRRKQPNLKYIIVPELHQNGGYHFHGLLKNTDNLTFTMAINNQKYRKNKDGSYMLDINGKRIPNKYYKDILKTRYPNGKIIYNLDNYNLGFTQATKVENVGKAINYIMKYITKELCKSRKNKRRYLCSRNIEEPTVKSTLVYNNQELQEFVNNNTEFAIEYKYGKQCKVETLKYENVITYYVFDRIHKN